MNRMNKKEFSIYILTLFYIIPFGFIVTCNMFFSLFQTTYMELYLDTEKPLYKADSPLLLLLLVSAFIAFFAFIFFKFHVSSGFCSSLEKASLVFSVILCLLIIFIYRVNVACDSKTLSNIAVSFLQGDYSSLFGDAYLVHYPHQLGMTALIEIVYFIFGIENFTVLQILNIAAIFSVIFFLHRITEELFHNLQIQSMLSLLCMGMLPLYLLATFIYGDIPGLGLTLPAIYLVIKYLNTQKKKLLLPAFFCMTFAILLKSNNSVILVAVIIILILQAVKAKDLFAVLLAALFIIGPMLGNLCIDSYYAKAAGLEKIPDGIPKIAWIAMGLQENDYLENGWYNSYNWDVYSRNNHDAEKTTSVCMLSIKESVNSFLSAPKSGLRFFYRKFISQWNDPTFASQLTNEWYSRHRDDHSSLALYLIYGNGRFLLEFIMNVYHFFILFGTAVFAILNIKSRNLSSSFLILCVFGGYFFHLIWEAGNRYGLGYFILCVPMASYGLWQLSIWTVDLFKKLKGGST